MFSFDPHNLHTYFTYEKVESRERLAQDQLLHDRARIYLLKITPDPWKLLRDWLRPQDSQGRADRDSS